MDPHTLCSYDQHVTDTWHTLASDEALAAPILDMLLHVLETARPYETKEKAPTDKKAADKLPALAPMKVGACGRVCKEGGLRSEAAVGLVALPR